MYKNLGENGNKPGDNKETRRSGTHKGETELWPCLHIAGYFFLSVFQNNSVHTLLFSKKLSIYMNPHKYPPKSRHDYSRKKDKVMQPY